MPAVAGCEADSPPDVVNGKQLFIERCGTCHVLDRADTAGTIGPSLDASFAQARRDGVGESTIEGVVHGQIDNPREGSQMPADLVTGDDARDVAAYVAMAAGVPGEDTGQLAQVGAAGAEAPEQIFATAGCGGCHTLSRVGSQASIGPSLDDIAQVARERRPRMSAAQYLREAIVEPDAYAVPGFSTGVMPGDYDERLDEKQIDTLVEFLLEEPN